MSAGVNVLVHESQHPGAVAGDLFRSLRRRQINHKFHYDTFKQAAKWLALHEAHSPARRDPACQSIYERAYLAVAAGAGRTRPVQVLGLGCGGGQKEASLLKLLARQRVQVKSYVPSDVSTPLVLCACQKAVGFVKPEGIQPLVVDLSTAGDFSELVPPVGRARRICTFFGMIPNFEPGLILPQLAHIVQPEDSLLLSANLVPEPIERGMRALLSQYDNELTRDWLLTFLLDLGFERKDGAVRFTIETASHLPRFVARYHLKRKRAIRVQGREFTFRRAEMIRLFFSYRYTPELLARALARHQLAIAASWITPSQEEGVFLVKRSSRIG